MGGIAKCLEHKADLSIYAQADEILFVCAQRHWWIVRASDAGRTTQAATRRAMQGVVPERLTAADKSLVSLKQRFGEDVLATIAAP